MYLIREAISMITKYVILLGLFALFATIHALLRDSPDYKENKHVSRAEGVFHGFKFAVALTIVGHMLVLDLPTCWYWICAK